MELKELGSLVAVVESDCNVTEAAERLHIVQSAVSQHIARLEQELGTRLFLRKGKRLLGLTESGEKVLAYARQALAIRENIVAIGRDHVEEAHGVLRIGTTHTQARYVLPPIIRRFRNTFPDINLQIHQGAPRQLVDMALNDQVDFSICTEHLRDHPALTSLPVYRWNRCLIAPPGHPVLNIQPLSLDHLCEFPLISYTFGLSGSTHLKSTLARSSLRPNIVLSAVDTDIIKTYVREGLGIGLIARVAYSELHDADLVMRDLSHLLPWETTWVAYHQHKYLRKFQQRFIELLEQMTADNGMVSS